MISLLGSADFDGSIRTKQTKNILWMVSQSKHYTTCYIELLTCSLH